MKKVGSLLVLLLTLLVIPFAVYADDDKEVNVYFFRGEGCSHCAEAEAWFESIEEEYGSYFKIVDYETWYNEDNSKLMQEVAELRGESADGVPYIIIGDKSWAGFTESYGNEMLDEIKSNYEKDVSDRYDVMEKLSLSGKKSKSKDKDEKSSGNDVVALLVILVVVGGVSFGVYKARSEN